MKNSTHRIIISGGGTGGHIYPALSIANAIKELAPQAEILFVGAQGRMEMEKVPQAGYRIIGLPIAGWQRDGSPKSLLQNATLPYKLLRSHHLALKIIRQFKPTAAVGVGGYASGPLLWAASQLGIPYFLQEQNSFAGKTNKILARKAQKIFVAYRNMQQFFPQDKIVYTGNPIRRTIAPATQALKAEALEHFGLDPGKKTLLSIGGSLGAPALNQCAAAALQNWQDAGVQLLWQTGKNGYAAAQALCHSHPEYPVVVRDFISRMDLAFAAADVVISRAGAGTISELCAAGKACIFVPSPYVAEDHQTHNAQALVGCGAALMVPQHNAATVLYPTAFELLNDSERIQLLEEHILMLAQPDAARAIAQEILEPTP